MKQLSPQMLAGVRRFLAVRVHLMAILAALLILSGGAVLAFTNHSPEDKAAAKTVVKAPETTAKVTDQQVQGSATVAQTDETKLLVASTPQASSHAAPQPTASSNGIRNHLSQRPTTPGTTAPVKSMKVTFPEPATIVENAWYVFKVPFAIEYINGQGAQPIMHINGAIGGSNCPITLNEVVMTDSAHGYFDFRIRSGYSVNVLDCVIPIIAKSSDGISATATATFYAVKAQ
jgi:hypothetical protein